MPEENKAVEVQVEEGFDPLYADYLRAQAELLRITNEIERRDTNRAVGESWDNAVAVGHVEWRPEDYLAYPPPPGFPHTSEGEWAEGHPFRDLIRFQTELERWAARNFGEVRPGDMAQANQNFIGVVEEFGELADALVPMGRLAHHLLKDDQSITGSHEEHEVKAQDAVGDVFVFLVHLCVRRGWSFAEIVRDVWGNVSQRDYAMWPETGGRPPKDPGMTDEEIAYLRDRRVKRDFGMTEEEIDRLPVESPHFPNVPPEGQAPPNKAVPEDYVAGEDES